MKLLIYTILFAAVISCNKKENEKSKKPAVPDSLISYNETKFKIDKIPENCYLMVTGKDSTAIQLVDNLGTINGKMAVKNFEKDSSTGDLAGFKNEDTLKLVYTFKSEGVTSENDVYFLLKNNELVLGIGDYKNPRTLKYDSKNSYKKVNFNQVSNLLK